MPLGPIRTVDQLPPMGFKKIYETVRFDRGDQGSALKTTDVFTRQAILLQTRHNFIHSRPVGRGLIFLSVPVIDTFITPNSSSNDLIDILVKLKNLFSYFLMLLKCMANILFIRRSCNKACDKYFLFFFIFLKLLYNYNGFLHIHSAPRSLLY